MTGQIAPKPPNSAQPRQRVTARQLTAEALLDAL